MFIPAWFFNVAYALGAFFLISAIFTKITGNLFLLGKLKESVTNNKKAANALFIYLLTSAALILSMPFLAEEIGRYVGGIFVVFLLYSIVFWYYFQSKWVGEIKSKQTTRKK